MKPPRKLNVSLLPAASVILRQKLTEALGEDSATANANADGEWCTFKNSIFTVAADTLGFVKRSHRDWFDESDLDISKLLDMLHKKHHKHLDKTCQMKKITTSSQNSLFRVGSARWKMLGGREDLKIYRLPLMPMTWKPSIRSPCCLRTGTTPVRAADQTTLLTDKADNLTRWAEHFNKLLNRESSISNEAIAPLPQRHSYRRNNYIPTHMLWGLGNGWELMKTSLSQPNTSRVSITVKKRY